MLVLLVVNVNVYSKQFTVDSLQQLNVYKSDLL